jgi:hypothetical protein
MQQKFTTVGELEDLLKANNFKIVKRYDWGPIEYRDHFVTRLWAAPIEGVPIYTLHRKAPRHRKLLGIEDDRLTFEVHSQNDCFVEENHNHSYKCYSYHFVGWHFEFLDCKPKPHYGELSILPCEHVAQPIKKVWGVVPIEEYKKVECDCKLSKIMKKLWYQYWTSREPWGDNTIGIISLDGLYRTQLAEAITDFNTAHWFSRYYNGQTLPKEVVLELGFSVLFWSRAEKMPANVRKEVTAIERYLKQITKGS